MKFVFFRYYAGIFHVGQVDFYTYMIGSWLFIRDRSWEASWSIQKELLKICQKSSFPVLVLSIFCIRSY